MSKKDAKSTEIPHSSEEVAQVNMDDVDPKQVKLDMSNKSERNTHYYDKDKNTTWNRVAIVANSGKPVCFAMGGCVFSTLNNKGFAIDKYAKEGGWCKIATNYNNITKAEAIRKKVMQAVDSKYKHSVQLRSSLSNTDNLPDPVDCNGWHVDDDGAPTGEFPYEVAEITIKVGKEEGYASDAPRPLEIQLWEDNEFKLSMDYCEIPPDAMPGVATFLVQMGVMFSFTGEHKLGEENWSDLQTIKFELECGLASYAEGVLSWPYHEFGFITGGGGRRMPKAKFIPPKNPSSSTAKWFS